MEEKTIRLYARLMQELGLTGLEIKENDTTLRLERAAAAGAAQAEIGVPAAAPAAQDAREEVCSPMVGVFYSAPAENAPPFVKPGDSVRKGDVLCIIEAMKLMNEITSECDGVVSEVCAQNGQIVDYGHVLFRIDRS